MINTSTTISSTVNTTNTANTANTASTSRSNATAKHQFSLNAKWAVVCSKSNTYATLTVPDEEDKTYDFRLMESSAERTDACMAAATRFSCSSDSSPTFLTYSSLLKCAPEELFLPIYNKENVTVSTNANGASAKCAPLKISLTKDIVVLVSLLLSALLPASLPADILQKLLTFKQHNKHNKHNKHNTHNTHNAGAARLTTPAPVHCCHALC